MSVTVWDSFCSKIASMRSSSTDSPRMYAAPRITESAVKRYENAGQSGSLAGKTFASSACCSDLAKIGANRRAIDRFRCRHDALVFNKIGSASWAGGSGASRLHPLERAGHGLLGANEIGDRARQLGVFEELAQVFVRSGRVHTSGEPDVVGMVRNIRKGG